MKIDIITVGKIKESFYRDAIGEYLKRLSKYTKIEIIEVADERTSDKASAAEEEKIKEKEGARILKQLKEDAFVWVLAIDGDVYDSVSFGRKIEALGINGKSHIQFVIGGSLGLHSTVLAKAKGTISFSKMTFPHQLMRVILLEQIYRGYRIMNGEPYHK